MFALYIHVNAVLRNRYKAKHVTSLGIDALETILYVNKNELSRI